MPKFKNPLGRATDYMRCPNCGALPYIFPPLFPWELPCCPPQITCRICEAKLIRDPDKAGNNGGEWRLREGAPVPPDTGDWPARARALHEEGKARELARIRRWSAEGLAHNECPACGVQVEIRGGSRFVDQRWDRKDDALTCQGCGCALWRPHKLMPVKYAGQRFGFNYPWRTHGTV